jgi:hypothetical protein
MSVFYTVLATPVGVAKKPTSTKKTESEQLVVQPIITYTFLSITVSFAVRGQLREIYSEPGSNHNDFY